MVTKGLHQSRSDAHTPFFLVQLRKRVFTRCYSTEMSLAAFLGRPPRLGYRYCLIEKPVDLADEDLLLTGDALQAALSRLGADGWNLEGRIGRATFHRVSIEMAIHREDILELALTQLMKDEILARASNIKDRMKRCFDSMPAFLRNKPKTLCECKGELTAPHMLYQRCVHFGFLNNQMLLQRVLVEKADGDPKELVETARKLFKEVLFIVTNRELMRDFQLDLSCILNAHGLRTAAVIAVELLKQEQCPALATATPLPRSEIIQDLSVFASSLSSIDPSDGNYELCVAGHRIIKRILDRILSPPPARPAESVTTFSPGQAPLSNSGLDAVLGWPNLGFDNSLNVAPDVDFMQWLENGDWDNNRWSKLQ